MSIVSKKKKKVVLFILSSSTIFSNKLKMYSNNLVIYEYIKNVHVFFINFYHLQPIYMTNDNDNKM